MNIIRRRTQALLLIVVLGTKAISQEVKIMQGTIVNNKDAIITMSGFSLVNDGTITGVNSRYVFNGNFNTSIGGTGFTGFNHIDVSKQGSDLLLLKNVTVDGNITFNGGLFNLGDKNIQLIYPGGMLQNENEQSRIWTTGIGEISISQVLNAPMVVNPGNLGLYITTGMNPGAVTVSRGHRVTSNVNNEQSIARYFSIQPASGSNLNATLRMHYFDAELNGIPESILTMWQRRSNWQSIGRDVASTSTNFVEKNAIDSLTSFTLGKGFLDAPLPLLLIAFNVTCKDANANVQWITANEVDTKQFIIEKSNDGVNWTNAAMVQSANNTMQHTYSTVVPMGNAVFFRLRMEDMDGTYSYSPVRKVSCDGLNSFVVGPNPVTSSLVISATMNRAQDLAFGLTDMSGRLLINRTWKVQKGLNSQLIDLSKYAAGSYVVSIVGEGVNEKKIILKR